MDKRIVDIFNSISDSKNFLNEEVCIFLKSLMQIKDIDSLSFEKFVEIVNEIKSKGRYCYLYKYYPNISDQKSGRNYSLEALSNDTIYVQEAFNFDDPYDCDLSINFNNYFKYRLIDIAKRITLTILDGISTENILNLIKDKFLLEYRKTQNFENAFNKENCLEVELLNIKEFSLRLKMNYMHCHHLDTCIRNIILDDFKNELRYYKNLFRISCFTSNPYSIVMWSQYANNHKGFCVEYKFDLTNEQDRKIISNIFPVIYSFKRKDLSSLIAQAHFKNLNNDELKSLFVNTVLRKSIEWSYQNERRFLFFNDYKKKNQDFNIKFVQISHIFFGNRMDEEEKRKIIKIAKKKSISYSTMIRNVNYFKMQECKNPCKE